MSNKSDRESRRKITITRQPLLGSTEDNLLLALKQHYDHRFAEKASLAIVAVYKPLYMAISGGDNQAVRQAIEDSQREIRDWHREALNQVVCSPNSAIRTAEPAGPQSQPANYEDSWPDDDDDPPMEF